MFKGIAGSPSTATNHGPDYEIGSKGQLIITAIRVTVNQNGKLGGNPCELGWDTRARKAGRFETRSPAGKLARFHDPPCEATTATTTTTTTPVIVQWNLIETAIVSY